MTDTERKGPGRPPGSRNKVDIRADVMRALKTGMSMTELKVFIEDYLEKLIKLKADPKYVIAILKQDIELIRHLQKLEIDFQGLKPGGKSDDDEDDSEGEDEDQPGGNGDKIVPIKFGNQKR